MIANSMFGSQCWSEIENKHHAGPMIGDKGQCWTEIANIRQCWTHDRGQGTVMDSDRKHGSVLGSASECDRDAMAL